MKRVPADGNCFYHAVGALTCLEPKFLKQVALEGLDPDYEQDNTQLCKLFGKEDVKGKR